MVETTDVQVGDYFIFDDDTVILIKELLSIDYYLCSNNVIHSVDELIPLESECIDWAIHSEYMGEAFVISKGQYGANGEERIFAKPAHIVQNHMQSSGRISAK